MLIIQILLALIFLVLLAKFFPNLFNSLLSIATVIFAFVFVTFVIWWLYNYYSSWRIDKNPQEVFAAVSFWTFTGITALLIAWGYLISNRLRDDGHPFNAYKAPLLVLIFILFLTLKLTLFKDAKGWLDVLLSVPPTVSLVLLFIIFGQDKVPGGPE